MNTPLKHYILLLLLLAIATLANAQQFGGNPPSIKWDQINTPAAKVIFPAGLDSSALIVANIVNQMNGAIQPTIGFKQRQVSILLQNQTTVPNAYVGLAPFRSEFYLTPEQNSFELGSLPWPEQLAIHEFRHVQQYNNFDVGFSKVLRTVFGEGGQAVGNELSIPNWFFEGDAVFNETHVSEQGRGRLPYFFNGFRALWADGRDYSYMKIRNGSYIDYTPDWYPLGYMLVSYGREKYGDDFWKKVTHDAAAFKGGLYPFERAVKKYSGVDFDTFRNDAYHHFMTAFKSDVPADKVSTHKHFDADREYPAYINDTTLIYMKSTYNHNPAFVVSIGNKERKISTRSYSIDNYFDYHDGKIVYASYRSDLRWNYRDYSELMILDVNTGKEHRITTKAKYFAPSFSPDGKTIVAVRVGPSGKSELHLLNGADGHLITTVPNKDRLFFTYPKFYGDDKLVSAVRTSEGKMSLAVISIKTGEVKYLLPFSYQPIAFPHIKNDTVYFSATHDIHDILCALSIKTGKLYKWDDPESLYGFIGKYEPAISNKKIAWVWFSADGYQIKEKNRDKIDWTQITDQQLQSGLPDMNISALKRDASTDLLGRVVDSSLKVTKYSKAYHLFNFHSLIPSIDDPNYTLSLSGENVLNTFQSDLSLTYNRDEGYKQFGFDAMYGALFPYIYGGVNYTLDRRAYYRGGNVYWNETNVYGGLELPLNFSEGKHFTYLTIGSDVNYSDTHFQAAYRNMFDDQAYTYLNSYITFSSSNQQPRQNIYPTFGQTIRFDYKNAISGLTASQFLADGNFYFPGFFTNHNFVLTLAHQQKGNTENVIDFSNDFPFARGYTAENLYKLNGVSLNYALPLLYPDAGLANTVYFQRVRGNVFFDYTHATDFYTNGNVFKGDFRSTGLEIYFDTKWFNQDSITFGFRYSRLLDNDLFGGYGRNRFEFIVPVSIF